MIRTGVLPHLGLLPFERLPSMYPYFGSGIHSPSSSSSSASSSSQTSHEDYLIRSTISPRIDRLTNLMNTTESDPRPMDNGFIWRSPRGSPSPRDSPRVTDAMIDAMIIPTSSTPVSSPQLTGLDELPTQPQPQQQYQQYTHHPYSNNHHTTGGIRFGASSPPKFSSSPLVYSVPISFSQPNPITFQPTYYSTPSSSISSQTLSSSPPSTTQDTSSSSSTSSSLVCRPQKRINFKLIQVDPSKETKRLKLPKSAIKVLAQWFAQHQDNPYPDDNDKTELAAQTNLTRTQINNWFSYARRRASKNKPPV